MTSGVAGLGHINFRAPEAMIEQLRAFYRDVIGLSDGPRPPFRSRGYWLYAGGRDLLHLTITADDPSLPARPAHTGWLDHFALTCTDAASMRARLDAARIPYELDEVPASRPLQIFLTDPAGVGVELNFAR
ncbi:MAG TPA: diguanylate cyclase [Dokdonella sp.]